ncbi:Dicer-like protein 1, partial [Haplosporangium sp. Z 27]
GLDSNSFCHQKQVAPTKTATHIFRRVVGAAISLNGADAGLRAIIALGMRMDVPLYTIKNIEVVYRQYHPANNQLSAQVLGTLDDNTLARIQTVQGALGYEFRNPQLLIEAITHKSATASTRRIESYERLELLGDAVVEFCITEAKITNVDTIHVVVVIIDYGWNDNVRSRFSMENPLNRFHIRIDHSEAASIARNKCSFTRNLMNGGYRCDSSAEN